MNKKNVIISAIEQGLSLSKRFLYYFTIGLGMYLAVLGLLAIIVGYQTHKAQSLSFYLYFLLLLFFGLFISYRGWAGQKAMKPIKTNQNDNDWVAVRAYPTSFWSYPNFDVKKSFSSFSTCCCHITHCQSTLVHLKSQL